MGMKYIKDGWTFPASFGFTGSATGNSNPRAHPTQDGDEFGDGVYLQKASDGPPTMAAGGKVPLGSKKIPAPKVAKAVAGALQVGKMVGQKMAQATPQAAIGPSGALGAPPMPAGGPPSLSGPPAVPGSMPGMRTGGKVKRYADGGPALAEDVNTDPVSGRRYGNSITEMPQHNGRAPFGPDETPGPRANAPHPMPRPTHDKDGVSNSEDGYANGGKFIKSVIKHPGRMKNLAKKHDVSVHQEMEHDKHSSSPSLRSAANMGLRLTGGDLSPHKRKR